MRTIILRLIFSVPFIFISFLQITAQTVTVTSRIVSTNLTVTGTIEAGTFSGVLGNGTLAGITSLGNLTAISVSGTATGGVFSGTLTGTLTSSNQPNITLLGTLSNLTVGGSVTATGSVIAGSFSTASTGGLDAGSSGITSAAGFTATGTVNAAAISTTGGINTNSLVVGGINVYGQQFNQLTSNSATNATVTLQTTGISFTVPDAGTYRVKIVGAYATSNTIALKLGVSLPSSTNVFFLASINTTATAQSTGQVTASGGSYTAGTAASGTNWPFVFEGIFTASATGTCTIQFAVGAANGGRTVQIVSGTWGIMERVN
jgi:hypothetical protein